MMTLKQINASADALASMFGAGTAIDKIMKRMSSLQPAQREFWQKAQVSVEQGARLSEPLSQVWPSSLVNAVRAGEASGKIEQALTQIAETTELQLKIQSQISKLGYPFLLMGCGVGIFIFYMIVVLPNIGRALGTKNPSTMMKLSAWLSEVAANHGFLIIGAFAVLAVMLASWIRSAEARSTVLNWSMAVPVLREALRDLYFGIWANYMAMMASAGISTTHGLKLTQPILPEALQESVQQFLHDLEVNHRSMSDAADPSLQTDDRAKWWPFYIGQAFLMADSTGRVDTSLKKVAPSLIKEGSQALALVLKGFWVVSIFITAIVAVSPLIAYYWELGQAFNQSGL